MENLSTNNYEYINTSNPNNLGGLKTQQTRKPTHNPIHTKTKIAQYFKTQFRPI